MMSMGFSESSFRCRTLRADRRRTKTAATTTPTRKTIAPITMLAIAPGWSWPERAGVATAASADWEVTWTFGFPVESLLSSKVVYVI